LGSRELDEENQKIAADEAIPNMIVMVSGGKVGSASFTRLEEQIKDRKKGRKGIMLLEAVSASKGVMGTPQHQPTIQLERTKAEQNSDALFQEYDKRNEDKILGTFRMPRALQGRDLGQNRATTLAMLRFAEEQIFQPRREDIDTEINEKILADLGIVCWAYETCSRQPKDPELVTAVVAKLTETGILTPNEGREIAGQIFNKELDSLEGLWASLPPRVLTVLLQTKNQQLASVLFSEDKAGLAELSAAAAATVGLDVSGTPLADDTDTDTEISIEDGDKDGDEQGESAANAADGADSAQR
jgi:hypothetical protein